jgi:predicted transcriptional regulator YdeE
MLTISEPTVIEHEPYQVVGAYCTFEGENEDPGWTGAYQAFSRCQQEIKNWKDSIILGFLYRPHRDHPEIPEQVRACFVGVDVTDLDHVPEGMSVTRFSGGKYAVVACQGDAPGEPAEGIGQAIQFLAEKWLPEHGYRQGDACFACSDEKAVCPPFVEYVYMKLEPIAG